MTELSVGNGILAAVVFLVFIGLFIFSLMLWIDTIDETGVFFSTMTLTSITLIVGLYLGMILGFVDLQNLLIQ